MIYNLFKEACKAFNYRNCVPMWAADNIAKGATLPDDLEVLLEELDKAIE